MFHAPNIHPGYADPYTNRGGPAFLNDVNNGAGYAEKTAQGIGTNIDPATGQPERRMGHLSCLQRLVTGGRRHADTHPSRPAATGRSP